MSLYYDDNEIRIFQQQQQQHHPTSEPSCVSTNKKKTAHTREKFIEIWNQNGSKQTIKMKPDNRLNRFFFIVIS